MKSYNLSLYLRPLFVFAACVIYTSGGCQQAVVEKPVFAPVFYPPPPNQARLQFLVSYSGVEDFDYAKASFFETVLLVAASKLIR